MALPKVYELQGVPTNAVPAEYLFAVDVSANPPKYYQRKNGVWIVRVVNLTPKY